MCSRWPVRRVINSPFCPLTSLSVPTLVSSLLQHQWLLPQTKPLEMRWPAPPSQQPSFRIERFQNKLPLCLPSFLCSKKTRNIIFFNDICSVHKQWWNPKRCHSVRFTSLCWSCTCFTTGSILWLYSSSLGLLPKAQILKFGGFFSSFFFSSNLLKGLSVQTQCQWQLHTCLQIMPPIPSW